MNIPAVRHEIALGQEMLNVDETVVKRGEETFWSRYRKEKVPVCILFRWRARYLTVVTYPG
jgi:hypothetical protein